MSVKVHRYSPPERRTAPRGRPAARRHRLAPLPAAVIGIILGGSALGGLGLGAIRLRHSPALALRSIQVQGLKNLDPQPLRELVAPLKGQPLDALSTESLRQRIEALPGVAGASVSKVLPDTLYVEVREREPVARVMLENSARLIDGSGALLGPAAPGAALPWLETADDGTGDERAALSAYAARMKTEAPALYRRISTLQRQSGTLSAQTDNQLQLLLPETPAAAESRLAGIDTAKLPGFGPGARLDLRFAGQVWYAPPAVEKPTPEKPHD
jgi:cell division protein FtsQ